NDSQLCLYLQVLILQSRHSLPIRDLWFQSTNVGHFLSKPTGESPQSDSSDAVNVSWMWKIHFLACMWAVGPLCGLTASLPMHKRLLSVYMHINGSSETNGTTGFLGLHASLQEIYEVHAAPTSSADSQAQRDPCPGLNNVELPNPPETVQRQIGNVLRFTVSLKLLLKMKSVWHSGLVYECLLASPRMGVQSQNPHSDSHKSSSDVHMHTVAQFSQLKKEPRFVCWKQSQECEYNLHKVIRNWNSVAEMGPREAATQSCPNLGKKEPVPTSWNPKPNQGELGTQLWKVQKLSAMSQDLSATPPDSCKMYATMCCSQSMDLAGRQQFIHPVSMMRCLETP
ncbi:hypothetical protein STEG23_002914, partial [Scotinomys teguina]